MTEEKWKSAIKEVEVQLCIDWLQKQEVVKIPNKRLHSYALKHVIENYYDTYISEASFVEAVKRLQIPYKECDTFSKVWEPDGTTSRKSWSIYMPLSLETVRFYSNKNKNAI